MQDQRKRLQFLDFKALRLSSISEMGKFRGGGQKYSGNIQFNF